MTASNQLYQGLKSIWKKLGLKGRVKNYSSKPIWVVETESGKAIAHLLPPMTKSPPNIDADGFRRVDGKPVQGHKLWWKIYDGSTLEVFDDGTDLKTSVIRKRAVDDTEFDSKGVIIYDRSEKWAVSVKLVTDVRRNRKRRITKYYVTGDGWISPEQALSLVCQGEIDNARPVFPGTGKPYVRTRRDRELFNNLEVKG
ncbi:MAG: DUF3892 domain-containing protein [Bdellovibrionota bacterium]